MAARVALAALAVAFLVPLFQALMDTDAQLRPGCDVPGVSRISRAFVPDTEMALPVTSTTDGECAVTASDGPLATHPGTSAGDATLEVGGGIVAGGTWSTADDTHLLVGLVDAPLLVGAVLLLVMVGIGAIILV